MKLSNKFDPLVPLDDDTDCQSFYDSGIESDFEDDEKFGTLSDNADQVVEAEGHVDDSMTYGKSDTLNPKPKAKRLSKTRKRDR